jgi:hypothetical protein
MRVVNEAAMEAMCGTFLRPHPAPSLREWQSRRGKLCRSLAGIAKRDCGLLASEAFQVDDDWYEERQINVCLMHERVYRRPILSKIMQEMAAIDRRYVVALTGDFPRNPILFTMKMTVSWAVLSLEPSPIEEYLADYPEDARVKRWAEVFRSLLRSEPAS